MEGDPGVLKRVVGFEAVPVVPSALPELDPPPVPVALIPLARDGRELLHDVEAGAYRDPDAGRLEELQVELEVVRDEDPRAGEDLVENREELGHGALAPHHTRRDTVDLLGLRPSLAVLRPHVVAEQDLARSA